MERRSHRPSQRGHRARAVGTPTSMAPEQILGTIRDQGPWTDLYALGCLAWRIVCGAAPFEAETPEHVLRKHVREAPSAFEPRFAVPEGFEAWLRALLAKSTERRTERPADAAWNLLQLDEPRAPTTSTPPFNPWPRRSRRPARPHTSRPHTLPRRLDRHSHHKPRRRKPTRCRPFHGTGTAPGAIAERPFSLAQASSSSRCAKCRSSTATTYATSSGTHSGTSAGCTSRDWSHSRRRPASARRASPSG